MKGSLRSTGSDQGRTRCHWGAGTVGVVAILSVLAVAGCGDDDSETTADGATGATGVAGTTSQSPPPTNRDRNPVRGPVAAIEHYYALLNAGRYDEAWQKLPPAVQAEVGGFDEWRAGYSTTIVSDPRDLTVDSIGAASAVVSLDLHAVDRDACDDRVEQLFTGSWELRKVGREWMPESVDFERVSGGTPVLHKTECPSDKREVDSPPPPPPIQEECTPGYSPCLPPDSDYDCEGGTGDGPSYTGTVQVTGSDPYELDDDADGIGCDP